MHPMPAFLSLLLLGPAADGWLGIYLDDRESAVVLEVIPDSPAAKAGLQAGDELLAIGDVATPTRDEFVAAIKAAKTGDRLSIKVRRNSQEQLVVVRLGERPDAMPVGSPPPASKPSRPQAPVPSSEPAPGPSEGSAVVAADKGFLGVSVRDSGGRVVVDRVLPDSPAQAAGIAVGDVLTSLGNRAIDGLEALEAVLGTAKVGAKMPVGLSGAAGTRSVMVTLRARPGEGAVPTPSSPAAITVAPMADTPVAPKGEKPRTVRQEGDVEAELAALRAELAELRRQLEALRQGKGRE